MKKEDLENLEMLDLQDSQNNNNFSLTDFLSKVWANRFWFTLSLIICVIIGILYVKRTPKTYSSSAVILIKDGQKGASPTESVTFRDILYDSKNSVNNEIGFLKSKRLMRRVVERLNLEISYKTFNGFRYNELYTSSPVLLRLTDNIEQAFSFDLTPTTENVYVLTNFSAFGEEYDKEVKHAFGDTLSTPAGTIVIDKTLSMDSDCVGRKFHVSKNSIEAVADVLSARLSVSAQDNVSALVDLSIVDENPNRAEDILNTLIKVYQEDAIEDKNRILASTITFIDAKLQGLEGELKSVDSKIEDYKRSHQITDIVSESSMYLQNYSRLDAEGFGVENQLNMAEYMKKYLEDNSKISELLPGSVGISDTGVESMIADYNAMMTKRNKLIANSSVSNPVVNDLQVSLTSLRSSILKALDNLIAGLNIQVRNFQNKESENSSKISNVPTQHKFVVSVERDQKVKEELYIYLMKKREGSDLQRSITESNCRMVDLADSSYAPIAPDKRKVMLLAIFIGLLLPALWITLRTLLDTKVYTKKELKDALDVPFIGELPYYKGKLKNEIVVQAGSRDVINEAFRIIRDNIDFMNVGENGKGKVILVTSMFPESGKTFVSSNLAYCLALTGKKILLMDLDLRKGNLSRRLEIGTHKAGISNFLSGKSANLDDVILHSDKGQAPDILSCGTLPPNPAELLRSVAFANLIEKLKSQYDYIIFDNPPFGIVADTSLCARLADMTVFVIRSGRFDKRNFPDLKEIAASGKFRHLCLLLNSVDYERNGYGYGYGYGYRYGYSSKSYGEGYTDVGKHRRSFIRRVLGI